MPTREAQKKARDKWNGKNAVVYLRVTPEESQSIREGANREGLTVTRYLVQCHREHEERQDGNTGKCE